jgi:hypothetical protein
VFLPGEISKTVSVIVNGDFVSESSETFFLNLSNAVNASIIDSQGVATMQNDDIAGITVSVPSGSVTTESGGAVTFTVVLNSEPLSDVTVGVTSSNTGEGSVSPASLVFTASTWNVPQTVTVTGVDDSVYDGNKAYTVIIAAAVSTDLAYSGINPADIGLTNNDNDPAASTRFFVVDDGAPDRTFEYSDSGVAIENYTVSTANSAPRGTVANILGNKVWVLDKNRNVYVYDGSGAIQGSWLAGSIATSATVEGIASDGTNIWIVDSKSDKIYYYAGAASRLSGTATLSASFPLASGNTNPKDLVFGSNGTTGFLWVVNDAKSDLVYRYSVNASTGGITFQTSWALNANNKTPTGITLDPNSTSGDMWVVDNGTTKQVYQYTAARSGTPTASSAVFTLSPTNSNPQGIADPPPLSMMPLASTTGVASKTISSDSHVVANLPMTANPSIGRSDFERLGETRPTSGASPAPLVRQQHLLSGLGGTMSRARVQLPAMMADQNRTAMTAGESADQHLRTTKELDELFESLSRENLDILEILS